MPKLPRADREIALRYAQLEELVGGLLDVHDDRRPALTARLRLFRQRGFPPGVRTGSKARFTYDLQAVVRVALAFQLIDGLVPQEAVPALIERHWDEIRDAFAKAFSLIEEKGAEDAAADDGRPILVLRPRNLVAFSRPKSEGDEDAPQSEALPAAVLTAEKVERRWQSPESHDVFGAVLAIDLQQLASWLRDALLAARWAVPESFTLPKAAAAAD